MKKIGIIPARMASARFPGKPMQMVGNQTILQRVYYQAASSKLDQIVIASGDDVILNHCQQNNFKNIETYYGKFAQRRVLKRMNELGIPYALTPTWVEEEDMWLYR